MFTIGTNKCIVQNTNSEAQLQMKLWHNVLSNKNSAESTDGKSRSYIKTTATSILGLEISVDPLYVIWEVLLGTEGILTHTTGKCPFPNMLSSIMLVQLPPWPELGSTEDTGVYPDLIKANSFAQSEFFY